MKYQMIDYLDKMIAQDFEGDILLLKKEGVLSSSGQIILNKLNLMAGTYASLGRPYSRSRYGFARSNNLYGKFTRTKSILRDLLFFTLSL